MRRLTKHGVSVAERQTRVRLGSAMWEALQDVAYETGFSVHVLVTEIDGERRTRSY
jgi:predicted DNA-binding ribbon-helix-helix protein